jgi:hypothetical protein
MHLIRECGEEGLNLSPSLTLSKIHNARPDWYRGDFHAHTNFSDGYYAPQQLLQVAKTEDLDFFAVTDHNTIAALSQFGAEQAMLIIPGVEVTLKEGHFNIFGVEGRIAWLESVSTGPNSARLNRTYATMTDIMREASTQELLTSINHPLLQPWEWKDATTDLRYVHCLEIWNDPSWPDNGQANPHAVALWTAALNAGYRITAIGGSDYHRPVPLQGQSKPPDQLGLPSTYVYADALSGAAVLEGLRRRRAYVSMGPQVRFQAHADDAVFEIGDDLGEHSGTITFTAHCSHTPAHARAQLVKNGVVIVDRKLDDPDMPLRFSTIAHPHESAWYRLDVIDRQGHILVVTNPMFVGQPQVPALHTFGDLVRLAFNGG